ncbi:MAG: dTDP-4-dehydrorhamnose reductase, partial [Firmicutes bacterium]|nr:dTDP-4-dehydrorhamnose reductase [Bacillota bacterium]
MKILVTGAGGQVGTELLASAAVAHELRGVTHAELDIADEGAVGALVRSWQPDAIIHAAAYTAVDRAETDADTAWRVNAMGSRNVAVAAEAVGARVCYISTDYVFDGRSDEPYHEYADTNPQSVYGRSKRAGEWLVQTLCRRWFVVRTAWVYGLGGGNFVKTMLKHGRDQTNLRVVDDQRGSPTYAADLAQWLLQLVATEKYGVYHVTNTGACTWYEFAQEIFARAGIRAALSPCTTAEFPRPALRPSNSVLA